MILQKHPGTPPQGKNLWVRKDARIQCWDRLLFPLGYKEAALSLNQFPSLPCLPNALDSNYRHSWLSDQQSWWHMVVQLSWSGGGVAALKGLPSLYFHVSLTLCCIGCDCVVSALFLQESRRGFVEKHCCAEKQPPQLQPLSDYIVGVRARLLYGRKLCKCKKEADLLPMPVTEILLLKFQIQSEYNSVI